MHALPPRLGMGGSCAPSLGAGPALPPAGRTTGPGPWRGRYETASSWHPHQLFPPPEHVCARQWIARYWLGPRTERCAPCSRRPEGGAAARGAGGRRRVGEGPGRGRREQRGGWRWSRGAKGMQNRRARRLRRRHPIDQAGVSEAGRTLRVAQSQKRTTATLLRQNGGRPRATSRRTRTGGGRHPVRALRRALECR